MAVKIRFSVSTIIMELLLLFFWTMLLAWMFDWFKHSMLIKAIAGACVVLNLSSLEDTFPHHHSTDDNLLRWTPAATYTRCAAVAMVFILGGFTICTGDLFLAIMTIVVAVILQLDRAATLSYK